MITWLRADAYRKANLPLPRWGRTGVMVIICSLLITGQIFGCLLRFNSPGFSDILRTRLYKSFQSKSSLLYYLHIIWYSISSNAGQPHMHQANDCWISK
jgi:hypothetical protein